MTGEGLVHIAGLEIAVGPLLRQRCGWCGVLLIDHDLSRLQYPDSTPEAERTPCTWNVGQLVCTDGQVSYVVDHIDGDPLPADACARLDAAVTR